MKSGPNCRTPVAGEELRGSVGVAGCQFPRMKQENLYV